MAAWIAVKRVRQLAATPMCANEWCSTPRWQLWGRRSTGARLNGHWYCGDRCFHAALSLLIAQLPAAAETAPSAHRLPLGLLMLSRGAIDEAQLRLALAAQQKSPGRRIGECLCSLGAVSVGEVTRALGAQYGLPVLSAYFRAETGLPLALMKANRCLGLFGHYHPSLLYVGFDGPVDRRLLSAAEAILGCQCEPCIVDARLLDDHLESRQREKNPDEIVFDTRCSSPELVRSICSYAAQLRAGGVRVAATRDFLWARISGVRNVDLLFRI